MGFFNNFFGNASLSSADYGSGDAYYDDSHPLLGLTSQLSYEQCRDIYLHWPLGKRIARALPNFAMSAPRDVSFDSMPEECKDRFLETCEDYNVEKIIKETATLVRVYGMAGIYIAHSERKPENSLKSSDFSQGRLCLNVVDPLNLVGAQIVQDPLSVDFQKLIAVKLQGQSVHPSRLCVLYHDMSMYLQWAQSAINYASVSVYQNMTKLIRSWYRCTAALERMATKAGSLIYKHRDGAVINAVTKAAAERTLSIIRNMQNDGIASVEKDSEIEFFSLTGISEIDAIISQLNQAILMALNDTPSAILLDKELAQGFGNGSEDMKAILMAVEAFRQEKLKPLYDFTDNIMLKLAFTDEFVSSLLQKYKSDFRSLSTTQLKAQIIISFSYKWGNLYPESEETKISNMSNKLDNLAKLRDLGANLSDIETIINNDKDLFVEQITLDSSEGESISFDEDDSSFYGEDIEGPQDSTPEGS